MKTYISVKCPYCGAKTKVITESFSHTEREVVTCDDEETNYCNKYFVLSHWVTVHSEVRKIEGEEK